MKRVVRGSRFVDDLTDAYAYLALHSSSAPERLLREVDRVAGNLAEFPETGAPRLDIDPIVRMRRLRGFNYLVFYDYSDDLVMLMRLLHSARNLPDVFVR